MLSDTRQLEVASKGTVDTGVARGGRTPRAQVTKGRADVHAAERTPPHHRSCVEKGWTAPEERRSQLLSVLDHVTLESRPSEGGSSVISGRVKGILGPKLQAILTPRLPVTPRWHSGEGSLKKQKEMKEG